MTGCDTYASIHPSLNINMLSIIDEVVEHLISLSEGK